MGDGQMRTKLFSGRTTTPVDTDSREKFLAIPYRTAVPQGAFGGEHAPRWVGDGDFHHITGSGGWQTSNLTLRMGQ